MELGQLIQKLKLEDQSRVLPVYGMCQGQGESRPRSTLSLGPALAGQLPQQPIRLPEKSMQTLKKCLVVLFEAAVLVGLGVFFAYWLVNNF